MSCSIKLTSVSHCLLFTPNAGTAVFSFPPPPLETRTRCRGAALQQHRRPHRPLPGMPLGTFSRPDAPGLSVLFSWQVTAVQKAVEELPGRMERCAGVAEAAGAAARAGGHVAAELVIPHRAAILAARPPPAELQRGAAATRWRC